jgi:hypothetical protein
MSATGGRAPPPLTNSEPEAADPVSLEQQKLLRQQGGPSLEAFRDRMAAMLHAGAGGFTAGEIFASALAVAGLAAAIRLFRWEPHRPAQRRTRT